MGTRKLPHGGLGYEHCPNRQILPGIRLILIANTPCRYADLEARTLMTTKRRPFRVEEANLNQLVGELATSVCQYPQFLAAGFQSRRWCTRFWRTTSTPSTGSRW